VEHARPGGAERQGRYDVHPLGFTSFQDRVVRLQAIQQFLGLVLADPELRQLVRLDDALREVCKALDLDPDQWLKSVQQLQQEAQAQQDVAAVLEAETQQAQTAKLKAEAVRAEAETAEIGERAPPWPAGAPPGRPGTPPTAVGCP